MKCPKCEKSKDHNNFVNSICGECNKNRQIYKVLDDMIFSIRYALITKG